jgi:Ion channel
VQDGILFGTMRQKNQRITKPTDAPLFPFRVADRGLSFFLAFLVIITIFVPMIRLSRSGRFGLDLIFAFMLFSGAIATIRQKALMYLVVALTAIEFAGDLVVEFNPLLAHLGWDTALKVSGLAILVVMTLRHTFRPGRVSVHRVMGGVAAYLLIGLTWAFGYRLLIEERPDAIHFQPSIAGHPTAEPSPLIYFSFATLTSVSYGDAYPVHRVARSLAMAEALIGQLYPSILIATLVGMALQARSSVRIRDSAAEKSDADLIDGNRTRQNYLENTDE